MQMPFSLLSQIQIILDPMIFRAECSEKKNDRADNYETVFHSKACPAEM